jgi:hypothetical protein
MTETQNILRRDLQNPSNYLMMMRLINGFTKAAL